MMKNLKYYLLSAIMLLSVLSSCIKVTPPVTQTGDTLRLISSDPITLDPALSGDMTSHQYIMQLFSGLVRLDDDLEPVADIASEWQVDSSGTVYTFTLQDDVKFHDGEGVTADDFKYSWERACYPETGSNTALTYLGDIVGVEEMLAGESREISGVRVIDEETLEVTIDAAKPYFLAKLTYPTAFVVERDNVSSGAGWWRKPNGTGPFKLQEWQQADFLILARNDDFYGQVPLLDAILFQFYSGVAMNLYEVNEIDVAPVGVYYLDKVTDPDSEFYNELEVVPQLSFSYLGYNNTEPPFDDVNIRRAFSMAVDKEKMASLVFRDMVEPADGILPPGIPGYNPDVQGVEFDIQQAKELIAQSSYGSVENLPSITLTTIGYGGLVGSSLETIIEEWRRNLGVEVKVRQLEPERFLYYISEEQDQLYEMGWVADYPHPQDFLEILFHSDADNNYNGYSNPAVDQLLDEAGVTLDENTSWQLYQQAEQQIVDDVACLPLWFSKDYYLVKSNVHGYHVNAMGLVMLNEVYLD